MEQLINDLINKWRNEAGNLAIESVQIWDDLQSGKLAQIDSVIYSVYQKQSKADTYRECAWTLEQLLKSKKG